MGFTKREQILYDLISEISEKYFCAGWLDDTERYVWRLLHEPGFSWSGVTADDCPELDLIRFWAEKIDRWIDWSTDDDPQAVTLAEWRRSIA